MSTTVMAACWPLQMPPTAKAVLVSLADNANDHGHCWPSLETIAARTCTARRAVIDAIHYLERCHALRADHSQKKHKSTQYFLTPSEFVDDGLRSTRTERRRTRADAAPVQMPHPCGKDTRADAAPVGVQMPHPTRADAAPKPPRTVIEPSKDQEQVRVPQNRGTALPQNWEPNPDELQWAAQERPDVDVRVETDKFRDYWRAVPGARGRKLDWAATFRNWIRNAKGQHAKTEKLSHVQRTENALRRFVANA